jgi:hypothetical protein
MMVNIFIVAGATMRRAIKINVMKVAEKPTSMSYD